VNVNSSQVFGKAQSCAAEQSFVSKSYRQKILIFAQNHAPNLKVGAIKPDK